MLTVSHRIFILQLYTVDGKRRDQLSRFIAAYFCAYYDSGNIQFSIQNHGEGFALSVHDSPCQSANDRIKKLGIVLILAAEKAHKIPVFCLDRPHSSFAHYEAGMVWSPLRVTSAMLFHVISYVFLGQSSHRSFGLWVIDAASKVLLSIQVLVCLILMRHSLDQFPRIYA